MVTNKFDAATLHRIGAEIEQALAIIADKHGISIWPLGGPYGDTSATIHLQLLVLDSAGGCCAATRFPLDHQGPSAST